MSNIVHFEVNDWFTGRDYPDVEPFLTWMKDDLNLQLRNNEWAKQNRLCIITQFVDMSVNFCVTADETWVTQNCPCLLTTHTQFLVHPNKYGEYIGKFNDVFLAYSPENYGVHQSKYEDGKEVYYDED